MRKKESPKAIKNVIKKVVKEQKKVVNKLEDIKYWQKRPADDTRKDWRLDRDTDWVSEYWGSQAHPHRSLITEALVRIGDFGSLLEVGCNCGPNLQQIRNKYPKTKLYGIDASPVAVEKGQRLFGTEIQLGTADKLPVDVDVILSDAVLIYAEPDYFKKIAEEFSKKAKKAIILVEWYDESKTGVEKDGHWARDYQFKGFELKDKIKITEQQWPNKAWSQNGYVFVFLRQ
ncbi:class I SAM-dependent methyltransferase [Candidatus Dojkabacteria bacterium]|jgi:trans-aconitate methyltransferase|nr:class I SAM-dependent methyltransferase [Candidatus Dojkabacteria bacterium]